MWREDKAALTLDPMRDKSGVDVCHLGDFGLEVQSSAKAWITLTAPYIMSML